MREAQSREIDGVTFTVQQMPVKRALRLLHKLARAGIPAMLKAVGGVDLKSATAAKLADLNLAGAGDAAAMLFDKLSADDLDAAVSELLESATILADGKEAPALKVLDVVLRGRLMTLGKALAFALEVNYGDFSDAFLAAAGSLAAPTAAPASKA